MNERYWIFYTALSSLFACGSDDAAPEPTGAGGARAVEPSAPEVTNRGAAPLGEAESPPALASCVRGTLEPDFRASPLAGPAVADGVLRPGQYVLSSTYLQLAQEPDSQRLFQELLTPVLADLQSRDGLAALALGQSESCSVARTLAVWEDDAAMLAFVGSPAHAAAVAHITDISRGGSSVTHWTGDAASASWATAAQRIAAEDRPQY